MNFTRELSDRGVSILRAREDIDMLLRWGCVRCLGQKGLGHMHAAVHLGTLANTTRPPAMQLAQSSHSTPTRLWFCSVVKHE